MKRSTSVLCVLVLGGLCLGDVVQAQPEFPAPAKENEWLQKFAGEWTTHCKATMGPDQSPIDCSGTIRSRVIGGFWVINEMTSDFEEASMLGVQTIGYDADKKKYVGTWVDSMTDYMWRYEGTLDESGKKLTLEAEGPNHMAGGKLTTFRDAYEFTSPDQFRITSSMLGEDGKWTTFMSGDATRTKLASAP